jgi:hypothetical protein
MTGVLQRHAGASVVVAAALALAAAASAVAQSGAPTGAQCRALGTDEERIACLEARIDALEEALVRAQTDGSAPAEVATPATNGAESFGAEQIEVAAPAGAEPATRSRPRWLRMPGIPFLGRGDDDGGSEPSTAVAAAPAAAPAPPAPPESGTDAFGAEQVAVRSGEINEGRRAQAEEVLHAQIVDFQVLHRGRLVVALDNGQLWRQLDVDSRQVRLREGESYPVEIRRSGFGGYRMKVADNDRIMTVERLR